MRPTLLPVPHFKLAAPWVNLLQEQASVYPPDTFTASVRVDKVSQDVFGTYVLSCCREAVKASFYNKDKSTPEYFHTGEVCEKVLYLPYFKCYARFTLVRCFTNHLRGAPPNVQHAAFRYLMTHAVPGKCCTTPFTWEGQGL